MNDLIAYCGLNCETCKARIATVHNDEALRRSVAAEWTALNGVSITPEMIHCAGCRVDGVKTPYCAHLCPIRQCAAAKGVETCRACETHGACEKLNAILKNSKEAALNLKGYAFITLRDRPALMDAAAAWFHDRWRVPKQAYLDCMAAFLNGETEYGWYLCLQGGKIVSGLGVIENDFHERKDLTPNVCAVYTEPEHRGQGIAGRLLDTAVEDLRAKGVSPVYLFTDHTGFYERYGWAFYCTAQGDGEETPSRIYIHR